MFIKLSLLHIPYPAISVFTTYPGLINSDMTPTKYLNIAALYYKHQDHCSIYLYHKDVTISRALPVPRPLMLDGAISSYVLFVTTSEYDLLVCRHCHLKQMKGIMQNQNGIKQISVIILYNCWLGIHLHLMLLSFTFNPFFFTCNPGQSPQIFHTVLKVLPPTCYAI